MARGLRPPDVVNASNAQSLPPPSGTAKIGNKQCVPGSAIVFDGDGLARSMTGFGRARQSWG
jgi:hypothetical protein